MRLLFRALLAASAIIPTATVASAQDAPGPRERGPRERPPLAMERPDRAGGWNRDPVAPREAFREDRREIEQARPPAPDAGGRPDRDGGDRFAGRVQGGDPGWSRRGDPRSTRAEANLAINRPGGPDRDNPHTRPDPRPDFRRGWDGRRDDRFGPDRQGWNRERRDDRGTDWNRDRGDRPNARNDWDQPNRWNNGAAWSRTWRNDNRYDWNRYRTQNRSAYRLPRYYAPSGWGYGYRRYSIGAMLNATLWDRNYWIDDPYAYRLPEVYGPYRWVRYYDDALLVDIRTGRVVDLVADIFW